MTAAACNYLPQVRVLARSFTRHHPGRRITVLLTDRRPDGVDFAAEPFDALFPDDVGIPAAWTMTHSRKELAAAAKPHVMLHALAHMAVDAAIFVDPDMIVLGAMPDVEDVARRHSITLRPHFLSPGSRSDDLLAFVEDRVLEAGMYNGGLIGASTRDEARAFLAWWSDQHADGCRHDLAAARHFDQRWLELAPSFCGDVGHFDDPGLNVAFWSLPGAVLHGEGDTLTIDGHPVRLLHFTGFIAEQRHVLTAYFPELLRVDEVPALAPFYERYVEHLLREGRNTWRDAPYGFGQFDDGSLVPDAGRHAYRRLAGTADVWGNPFRTGPGSLHSWLAAAADGEDPPIAREWVEAHGQREHLRQAFPDPLGADRHAFHAWTQSDEARVSRVIDYIIR